MLSPSVDAQRYNRINITMATGYCQKTEELLNTSMDSKTIAFSLMFRATKSFSIWICKSRQTKLVNRDSERALKAQSNRNGIRGSRTCATKLYCCWQYFFFVCLHNGCLCLPLILNNKQWWRNWTTEGYLTCNLNSQVGLVHTYTTAQVAAWLKCK